MVVDRTVLFSGDLDTHTVRVCLEADSRGVSVLSHDIEPALTAGSARTTSKRP